MGAIAVLAAGLVWVVSGTLEPRIVNAGDTAPNFASPPIREDRHARPISAASFSS
jgi:hypothetical protein